MPHEKCSKKGRKTGKEKTLKKIKKLVAKKQTMVYNKYCSAVNNLNKYAPLAQLEEHLTLNQGVQGSSPWRCTRVPFRALNCLGWCFYFAPKQVDHKNRNKHP